MVVEHRVDSILEGFNITNRIHQAVSPVFEAQISICRKIGDDQGACILHCLEDHQGLGFAFGGMDHDSGRADDCASYRVLHMTDDNKTSWCALYECCHGRIMNLLSADDITMDFTVHCDNRLS